MIECKKCHYYFSVVFTSKRDPAKFIIIKRCTISSVDLLTLGAPFISGTEDKIQIEDGPIVRECTGYIDKMDKMEDLTTIRGTVGHG